MGKSAMSVLTRCIWVAGRFLPASKNIILNSRGAENETGRYLGTGSAWAESRADDIVRKTDACLASFGILEKSTFVIIQTDETT
jgi:hypothetical protein